MENKAIKPRLPGGFRDYLPDDCAKRQWVVEQTAKIYRSFGFKQLDTSAVEYFETLCGGDETSKQIYRLFNRNPDFTGESLALRFDLTVSLARMLAMNRNAFTMPFKRYQMGEVWRGERQQKGRFKQFLQFDADIVGTANPSADAEIIIIMDQVMKVLGIEEYTIRLNNRKILNGLAQHLGLKKREISSFLRILDKKDKVGWEGVRKRLSAPKGSIEDEQGYNEGLGLKEAIIEELIMKYFNMNWDWEAMGFIKKELSHFPEAIIGINEIEKIRNLTFASKVDKNKLKFDLSLARGLEYYTGAVFELTLDRLPHFGSVMGGGRYDNLLARFGVESMPATGVSLGVDRLVVGLEELGLLKKSVSPMKALVVGLGEEMESNAFSIASSLRSEGIDCEIYLGENRGLKKQMEYAHRQGITYCVIIGTEEWNFRKAQIKNMKTAEQVEYDLKRVAEVLKTADGE